MSKLSQHRPELRAWTARRGPGLALALGLALGLVACGGGGGGGGTEVPNNPPLTLQLANVQVQGATITAIEGNTSIGDVTIQADVTGNLSQLTGQNVVIVVEDPDALFTSVAPQVSIVDSGRGNQVILTGNAMAGRAGRYTGTLKVHVCLDAGCTREFGNSPVNVAYDVTVLPGPRVSNPTPLVIETDFGVLPPPLTMVIAVPAGTQNLSVGQIQTTGGPAIDLPLAPLGPVSVNNPRVDLQGQRLPPGTYNPLLLLGGFANLGTGAYGFSLQVPVTYTVRAVPGRLAAMQPERADLVSTVGTTSTFGGLGEQTVLAANGVKYDQLSRVVYLPGNGTRQDAGSHAWLPGVNALPNGSAWTASFAIVASPCLSGPPPSLALQCLAAGRYEAQVYFKSAAGVELAAPLPVSLTLN
jgi:hypothetical protein